MSGTAPPLFHRVRLRTLQTISYMGSPPLRGGGVCVCVSVYVRTQKRWLCFRFCAINILYVNSYNALSALSFQGNR